MKFNEEGEAIHELIADPEAKHKPCLLNQTCLVIFVEEIFICLDHTLNENKKCQKEKAGKKKKKETLPCTCTPITDRK